jgi:hypothetical protein
LPQGALARAAAEAAARLQQRASGSSSSSSGAASGTPSARDVAEDGAAPAIEWIPISLGLIAVMCREALRTKRAPPSTSAASSGSTRDEGAVPSAADGFELVGAETTSTELTVSSSSSSSSIREGEAAGIPTVDRAVPVDRGGGGGGGSSSGSTAAGVSSAHMEREQAAASALHLFVAVLPSLRTLVMTSDDS